MEAKFNVPAIYRECCTRTQIIAVRKVCMLELIEKLAPDPLAKLRGTKLGCRVNVVRAVFAI